MARVFPSALSASEMPSPTNSGSAPSRRHAPPPPVSPQDHLVDEIWAGLDRAAPRPGGGPVAGGRRDEVEFVRVETRRGTCETGPHQGIHEPGTGFRGGASSGLPRLDSNESLGSLSRRSSAAVISSRPTATRRCWSVCSRCRTMSAVAMTTSTSNAEAPRPRPGPPLAPLAPVLAVNPLGILPGHTGDEIRYLAPECLVPDGRPRLGPPQVDIVRRLGEPVFEASRQRRCPRPVDLLVPDADRPPVSTISSVSASRFRFQKTTPEILAQIAEIRDGTLRDDHPRSTTA